MKSTDFDDNDKLVLVDFYTNWSGSCKKLSNTLNQLKNKLNKKVKIVKVNVSNDHKLADKYRVLGVPTISLFKDGEEVWRNAGVLNASRIEEVVEKYSNKA